MKKEKILVYLLGANILLFIYDLPTVIESNLDLLLSLDKYTLPYYLSFMVGLVLYWLSLGIGTVGIVQYASSQNINNYFLRIYFLFSAVQFVEILPSNIYSLFAHRDEIELGRFFLCSMMSITEWVLIILIYGKRMEQVSIAQPATIRVRLSHYVVDTFILIVLSLSFGDFLRLIFDKPINLFVEFFLSFLLMRFIYYTIAEAIFQQTLGKMITKHYVTRNNGQRAGLWQIMGRSLTRYIPLEALSLLSNPANGWHDRFSSTNVYQSAAGKLTTEEDFLLDHLVEEDEV